jgi:hypothetical protein
MLFAVECMVGVDPVRDCQTPTGIKCAGIEWIGIEWIGIEWNGIELVGIGALARTIAEVSGKLHATPSTSLTAFSLGPEADLPEPMISVMFSPN